MKLDVIGRWGIVKGNRIEVNEEEGTVTKTYGRVSIPMAWSWFERKPLPFIHWSVRDRYDREAHLLIKCARTGLNTPRIVETDYGAPSITTRKIDGLTDLVDVFTDRENDLDHKLNYFEQALGLLLAIHEGVGEAHGDPYPKNWGVDNQELVLSYDFEQCRITPDARKVSHGGRGVTPQQKTIDVMILTAGTISLLRNNHSNVIGRILQAVDKVYGEVPSFPFDWRDGVFYKARFRMGEEFFDYFS